MLVQKIDKNINSIATQSPFSIRWNSCFRIRRQVALAQFADAN